MKKSLTFKLTLYFSAALSALIILVGALFGYLFQQKSEKMYVATLTSLAVALAENIGENDEIALAFPEEKRPPKNRDEAYYTRRTFHAGNPKEEHIKAAKEDILARRLRNLNRLSQGEVWLVDGKTRSFSVYGKENSVKFDKLPPEAEEMLETVLSGEKAVSRNFSPLLASPSITVGVPIFDKKGEPLGALLLHSASSGLRAVQNEAFTLLAAAFFLGLVIAIIFSALLAKSFIKPLKRMEEFAGDLAKEKYHLRSGITSKDEIGSLAKSLDLLAARLSEIKEEKNRLEKMRRDFLTGVSHELKTPITVLRGLLEMMTAGLVKTEEQRENCFKQMEKNILGLGRLVQDLFELSRLQNADFTIEKSELNLTDPLNDAIQAAKQMSVSKNISVQTEISDKPIIIQGDYGRLKQMFLIVMDNAVKFSPMNGKIEIKTETYENLTQISVSDQGEGINAEDLPHIFEKFHRQKNKNDGGTGLGLAIAKEIALRHDIKILCESQKGKGAKFIFTIYTS